MYDMIFVGKTCYTPVNLLYILYPLKNEWYWLRLSFAFR